MRFPIGGLSIPTCDSELPHLEKPEVSEIAAYLSLAWERANTSLETARDLQAAGFLGPSFVWAVRSVEIFTREFLLMPVLWQETNDVSLALRRANKTLGSGNWAKAYATLEREIGPLDEMLTDGDEDAWKHWNRNASDIRGNVVHGHAEIDDQQAEWAISYAEQLFQQLVLRMIVSGNHPASDITLAIGEAIGRAIRGPQQTDE